jgi:hypothetical protein
LYNEAVCEQVNQQFTDALWEASQPIGYDYPFNASCPLIPPSTNVTTTCTIGDSPVYAVNVTDEQDIVKTIQYAKNKNLRLVIKSTGHDFLQR